jgi:hypothetical protein
MSADTEQIDPWGNPAGVVYGVLTMGALLAAESARRETYWQTVGSALIALVLYWFAHTYAGLLGNRLMGQRRLSLHALTQAFMHDWAIVRGACVPLVGLLVCWALGAALTTAVSVAIWSCVACLIALEALAGVRAKAKPAEVMLEAGVGATMGLAILALRLVLH